MATRFAIRRLLFPETFCSERKEKKARYRPSAKPLAYEEIEARLCLSAVSFAAHDVATPATGATSVYAADMDGDGDVDVLAGGSTGSAWYENTNGQGSFGPTRVISTAPVPGWVGRPLYAADLDSDGDADVLSAGTSAGWYENTDGNGRFGPQKVIQADDALVIYPADVDGDGDADVLASQGEAIAFYENTDGNGSFGAPRSRFGTDSFGSFGDVFALDAADVDGDGDMDVLSGLDGWDIGSLNWYEDTDGGGTFGPRQQISGGWQPVHSVHSVDVDNDGDMDVLAAFSGFGRGGSVLWYENSGSPFGGDPICQGFCSFDNDVDAGVKGRFFAPKEITPPADGAMSVYSADVDGDGDVDVLTAGRSVSWYENTDGEGSFGQQQVIATPADGAWSVFSSDLDGDGDADVLAAADNKITWYENLGQDLRRADFSGLDLSGARFPGANLTDADFRGANLTDAVFDGATLAGAQLSRAVVEGASFAETISNGLTADQLYSTSSYQQGELRGVGLARNDLRGWNFAGQNLSGANLQDTDFSSMLEVEAGQIRFVRSSFAGADLTGVDFGGAKLVESDLSDANLTDAVLRDTTLTDADFTGATVERTSFINPRGFAPQQLYSTHDYTEEHLASIHLDQVDLSGWDFSGQDLTGARLTAANLSAADFSSADLTGALLRHSDLTNADFGEANLTDAAFDETTLTDADLSGASVAGTRFYEPVGFTKDQLYSTRAYGVPILSHNVVTTGSNLPTSVFAADVDGDDDLDVLSTSYRDKIAWYENIDGKGRLGPQQVIGMAAGGGVPLFAADLDGDGDVDILSTPSVFGNGRIAWYENTDGNGSFGPQQAISAAADATSVYAADVDGDGDIDVFSASEWGDNIAWYENTDGKGTFGQQNVITTAVRSATSVYVADLDGDRDVDVLSASRFDDTIAWYENTDGRGSFGPQQVISTEARGARSVYVADVDGDGDTDVLSASANDDTIAWYENIDSRGAFGPQKIISTAADGAALVVTADLDEDGDVDVLSASVWDSRIVWYENRDGGGIFGPPQLITTVGQQGSILSAAFSAQSVMATDMDGDGDIDVLAAPPSDGNITWYESFFPQPGDSNHDWRFDQLDIVQVLQAAKYLTEEPATFEEGDWNGDGVFDQLDIVAALQTGNYLQGPYAARL